MFGNLWLTPGGWKLWCCCLCPSLSPSVATTIHFTSCFCHLSLLLSFVVVFVLYSTFPHIQAFSEVQLKLQASGCPKCKLSKMERQIWKLNLPDYRPCDKITSGVDGILGEYAVIPQWRWSLHTRVCLWGVKETSLSEKFFFFWVTSLSYSNI